MPTKEQLEAQDESTELAHVSHSIIIPSFLRGAARVIDMGVTIRVFRLNKNPKKADFEALQSDWCAVGDDIRVAISLESKDKPATE
ncbi:MAG: hypothetical protein A3G41_02485 [Elusimicrobia bacterium RIFCSPLOWO2_12_FULL_59_9]|nr:MAG: hypothetical protein A3G41_02485 [Elusimicrobia bacterium RIFCSPLOWO2_12_FULL_59_9]